MTFAQAKILLPVGKVDREKTYGFGFRFSPIFLLLSSNVRVRI